MPREAREKSRTGIYHIVLRGINRQTIFEEDEDKQKFLETLERYKKLSGYDLYGYCMMDNHIHVLMRERNETVAQIMKRISSSYVYWYNLKYARVGHLFQERFHSECVQDSKYFLTVLRYIHQNPLKAGLVTDVWQSKWTSLQAYLDSSSLVEIEKGLALFSLNRDKAIKRYMAYMEEVNEDRCLDVLPIKRVPDHQVRVYLQSLGVADSSMLQQMDRKEREHILAQLKSMKGVTYRQLSRITGISKSVIGRIRGIGDIVKVNHYGRFDKKNRLKGCPVTVEIEKLEKHGDFIL